MSKFHNNLKTVLLMGALTAFVLWIGSLFGTHGLIIALAITAVMNLVSFFFSDKIAIMAMQAQEVGPEHRLFQIVAPLAQRAGLPMPRVYVAPHDAPNAFATGRSPNHAAVCATDGLLQLLSRDEIAGVMAHELAHVKHRDILIQSVATTIGGAVGVLSHMFMFGGGRRDENSNPLLGLAALIFAPIAAGLIQAGISRSREFNADRGGADILGDPLPLATALEKIHAYAKRIPIDTPPAFNSLFIAEPLNAFGSSMANLSSTHPPLEKRMLNLIGVESVSQLRGM